MEVITMSYLSPQQRYILLWLITNVRLVEQADPRWLKDGIDWWHQWTPKTADKTVDKSFENVWRASLCRSLARLEQWGLIQRIRGRKQGRTVRLRHTKY